MTSAVDIIAPKPAARPEPAAKASSRDDDRTSFADVLDAETSEPEAAPATKEVSKDAAPKEAATKDEPATPDTNVAAQPAQPQQPTLAVNSAEAILAGLTQAAPADAPTTEAGAATPAIDAAAPAAAPAAPTAPAPAGAAETSAAAAATAAQAAPKPATTPQPDASQADAAAEPVAQAAAPAATPATAPAAPAQTAQTAQAAPAATAAPASAPVADTAAPLSAPGEERTSATVEAANTSSNKTGATSATSTAADPAASKAQGAPSNTTQVAANASVASEATPDIKPDAAPPTTTTTVDPLATARSATETARAAQTSPALQNAPATTIQVHQRMVERFDGRAQRYEVRLDPAELGRVDVRIEVGADKKVHAVLAAHDSAALSDLMRGQRSLERALNDAGFDLAEGGIRFELSSDQGRNPANDSNGNGRSNVWRGFNTVDVAVDTQTAAAARPWRSSARLDVVA